MRERLITVEIILIVLFCVLPMAASKNQGKRYGLKQAHISYRIEGSMQSGTEDLYFANWGAREAKYTVLKTKVAGFTQETNTATFAEGAWIYTVDLSTNTGTKQANPLLKNMSDKELQDLGKNMMVQMGGKKVGEEKILGKNCEVWEIKNMGSKVWVWNWVPLKTEVNMGGFKMTYIATKISESFEKTKLNRPTNVTFNNTGNIMDYMKKMKK